MGVVGVVIHLIVTHYMSRTQRCITKLETLTWSMLTSMEDIVLVVVRRTVMSRFGSAVTWT